MIEAAPPRSTVQHPTLTSGSLQGRATLAPGGGRVLAGTPLGPSPLGWVPTKTGGLLVCGETAWAGEDVVVWRGAVLETHKKQFVPGARIGLKDIDDLGMLHFTPDPSGVYIALTTSILLLDFSGQPVVQSGEKT